MLRHLRVINFAILSDVAIDFGEGFNVLTGETGAGKSLIVEAVNLLRGGRASADIPRAGADQAVVEAIFEVPADLALGVRRVLREAGLPRSAHDDEPEDEPDEDGNESRRADAEEDGEDGAVPFEVLVRRVIQRGGRSRTYVNGALTTARRLAELGAWLVDLSGQHQHQGLVDPKRHRAILDAFADNGDARAAMLAAHEELRAAEQALQELGGDHEAVQQKIDYLRFQLEELDGAALRPGEDAALEAERSRLSSVDKLEAGTRQAEGWIAGGEFSGWDGDSGTGVSATDLLGKAHREIERLIAIDPALGEVAQAIDEARVVAEEAANSLRSYADKLEGDPGRLSQVEDRLALIARLVRKHGGDLAAVLAHAGELRAQLDGLENRDERVAELEQARARAEKKAKRVAAALTATRERAAETLRSSVAEYLAELGMASAALSVRIESKAVGADGADHVEFLLASNKGEQPKPLARIASGGELSRIMLAVKLSLRRADEVATYVFDEVDTGIGGGTAAVVARQIRALGDQRQVLCVTHLPQIVAFADQHYHVSKFESDGRTETAVRSLAAKERREEMARMLGGVKITKSARAHAEAMLEEAAKSRARARA
ncbi:DNA repair protein RecN [Haliangium ochraceum]|uniref:DNA repair protein RecN n=1 Tax=Haliangium ochraceum (strain DSM 14365 / JCM 11303 / SMP-2) TaxID=502025 RepID=D0LKG0_HALO1|nr:DNA repair protein RecN [Haliangium ochraceum]ACY15008.1 DNA repair protein RecN [Haliangium ochraceum DSM 14365]